MSCISRTLIRAAKATRYFINLPDLYTRPAFPLHCTHNAINLCHNIIFHRVDRNLDVSVIYIHVRIYASINIYCVTYTHRHRAQTQAIDLYSWGCGPLLRVFNPLAWIGRAVSVTGNVRDLMKAIRMLHPWICFTGQNERFDQD